jgi:uncharacterized protein with PIN domain
VIAVDTSALIAVVLGEAPAEACIPAGLNFGDCFAYAVAKEHRCRLLYVGKDFARTDIESVL